MFAVDRLILLGALLLIFGILSSKFSARLGLPALILFMGVGMLAGSEGIGGVDFENYALAHGVGTIALAVILFDGGLRTSLSSFRTAWKPALSLATIGVADIDPGCTRLASFPVSRRFGEEKRNGRDRMNMLLAVGAAASAHETTARGLLDCRRNGGDGVGSVQERGAGDVPDHLLHAHP